MENKTPTNVDELLKARRKDSVATVAPSDGFWDNVFAPKLTRKLMAALSRPRHPGRTLTIVGWTTPAVFLAVVAVALGVAYLFSPQRAIARWEKEASSKRYVMDSLGHDSSGKSYAIDGAQRTLKSEPTGGLTSYQFGGGAPSDSQF